MTRRVVYALALLPVVPTVSVLGVTALGDYGGGGVFAGSFDEIRWFHLFFSVLFVAGTILIWRRCVIWTLGRRWLTALVAMIPFVQVAFAQPLWTMPGCRFLDDEFLRLGQHEIGIGGWIWLSVWAWWGVEKMNEQARQKTRSRHVPRVSRRTRCLAASIGTIPATIGVFILVGVAMQDFFGRVDPVIETYVGGAITAIICWILIWRKAVVWSADVKRLTFLAAVFCFGIPIGAMWAANYSLAPIRDLWRVVLYSAPIIGWGVWMGWTIHIWPLRGESLGHDETGPRCLKCNYLLRGLRSTRCPECGDEPTLDELWAGTVGAPI